MDLTNEPCDDAVDRDMAMMPRRADFEMEFSQEDEDGGPSWFRMVPDRRRYTEEEREGKTWYVDKYLGYSFTLEGMANAEMPQGGAPIYMLPARIKSTLAYADARVSAIENELETGEYTPPEEEPIAHRELNAATEAREIGFLSVDICGATAARRENRDAFDRAYELFTRELGTVVGQFNGSILKTKGDGFIAFIDHPSFNSLCDGLIDMGLSILAVLHLSLNAALAKAGIAPLSIRIGADFGEAVIKKVAIPATGYIAQEVASDALNRAVKIEEACPPNQFWIGRCLYELIHVQWLERATETSFDGVCVGMPGYKTYRIV